MSESLAAPATGSGGWNSAPPSIAMSPHWKNMQAEAYA
jgi:hypothetical protein